MPLFKETESTQARLKGGILGFQGSGKTFTASLIMIGLIRLMRERGMPDAYKPVFFLDTETGSDWVRPLFEKNDIKLLSFKSRAFKDIVPAVREAEENASGMLIDSVTHFWVEFVEAYRRKKNRARLEFQDWGYLKPEWGRFTDVYVNSNLHIILCGRAGYEYDYFTDDDGRKNLEKTGVKMKAENEMGYEPSLLIMMEREVDPKTLVVTRTAHVLKDRSTLIDGKSFANPTFENIRPHIEALNLGGTQLGVDLSRTSEEMIGDHGSPDKPRWKYEQEQKEIVLEKIQALFTESGLSSQSQQGKRDILSHLKKHFGTTSWKELEGYSLAGMREGYDSLKSELQPHEPAQQISRRRTIERGQPLPYTHDPETGEIFEPGADASTAPEAVHDGSQAGGDAKVDAASPAITEWNQPPSYAMKPPPNMPSTTAALAERSDEDIAYQMGLDDFASGVARKAVPMEYRGEGKTDLAAKWVEGWLEAQKASLLIAG